MFEKGKKKLFNFFLPFVLKIKSIILTNNLFQGKKKLYLPKARTKCFFLFLFVVLLVLRWFEKRKIGSIFHDRIKFPFSCLGNRLFRIGVK